MISRHWFCVLAILLAAAPIHAQGVKLVEAPLAQACVRIELSMELAGKITVKQDDKENSFPHKAEAKHVFLERILDTIGNVGAKSARHYLTADSTITFNNNEASKRSLRDERRFLVAQRVKDQVVTFSPQGPMTRSEMELTEHFDTMAVAGLLPGKNVEVGKTWMIPNAVVAALCEFDGLTENQLEGKIEKVMDNIAHLSIAGKAQGINVGAQVGMLVNARCEFDIKEGRIVFLEWKETIERQQGPVSPALSADVTITLKRTPIEEPEQLNKFALVPVPKAETPPVALTNLRFQDVKKRFELSHARNWHAVSPDDNPQLVMRLVERGEFIAQATITPWKKIDPKNAMNLTDFAELVAKTPGWALDKETERKTLDQLPKGHHTVHRVIASGELEGVRTVQYFYLVVGTSGEQLIATFSVVPQLATRLGSADLEMVREIVFPE